MYETKRCVVIVVLMVRMRGIQIHGDVFFSLHNLIIFYVYV